MKSLKNLFKSEQFKGFNRTTITPEWASKIAQQELDQFIEENGVKVYGEKNPNGYYWGPIKNTDDSVQAILLDIQPLKECEHELVDCYATNDFRCRCGAKLKPKNGWEVV